MADGEVYMADVGGLGYDLCFCFCVCFGNGRAAGTGPPHPLSVPASI